MTIGNVVLFKDDRGYGFIAPEDGGNNVYVHISALQAAGLTTLYRRTKSTFDLHSEGDKVSAINIVLIDAA